ncbi:hypothetical protein Moror_3689 [Moniliophthora roreri MCA 2997]|uniref:Uncharacterized protein n=2 Tax=Moniliophthora roreri TaxID=221103 RepID=V2WQQ5_MONRO|nr:hypothetical protein Moror_3689 [Moniliophthora roreri MCA 2997]
MTFRKSLQFVNTHFTTDLALRQQKMLRLDNNSPTPQSLAPKSEVLRGLSLTGWGTMFCAPILTTCGTKQVSEKLVLNTIAISPTFPVQPAPAGAATVANPSSSISLLPGAETTIVRVQQCLNPNNLPVGAIIGAVFGE